MNGSKSILIVGSGAMACLFAARFAAAGITVAMLGNWAQGLRVLRQRGVTLVDDQGHNHTYSVRVVDAHKVRKESLLALVLVKSWQTEHAARQLERHLHPDGVTLTLQNGWGNREILGQYLGTARVALGVTTLGASLLGPGSVRQAGDGVISLGAHPGLAPIADLFRTSGFIVENAPDPNSLLWGKLIINAAINPITALLGVPNGEILESSSARSLLAGAAREAAAVAVAQGISLPYPDPVATVEAIARRTTTNRSSMLQDILRGAPTEIDAINGAVVRAGEQMNLATPINRTLWQLIKARVETNKALRAF
jgi:2-dehydropantoate 2-reductase